METTLNHDETILCQALIEGNYEKILHIFEKNHYLIYPIFEQVMLILEFTPSNDPLVSFCFELLNKLTQVYKVPFALLMNDPEVIRILESISKQGLAKELNKLLENCLVHFSFDKEKIAIRNVYDLWKKLNPDVKQAVFDSHNLPVTTFTETFCEFQNIINWYSQREQYSDENTKELYNYIKRFRAKISSNTPGNFNAMEEELLISYNGEILAIQASLESEIANQQLPLNHVNNKSYKTEKNKDPRFRTSFTRYEMIGKDESDSIEYKQYAYPFRDDHSWTLQKTICSFLNRRGGRIYIGIDDNSCVRGVRLMFKDKDIVKGFFQDMLKPFEPDIKNSELVTVMFIPVLNPKTHVHLEGYFVVKIIVKQGDPSTLYSLSKDSLRCYIRNHGQSALLSARETTEAILQRNKSPEKRIPVEEFKDPEPENIKEVYHNKEEEKYNPGANARKNFFYQGRNIHSNKGVQRAIQNNSYNKKNSIPE